MYFDEYGNKNNPTIVFLHGANFVHSFGRQYCLADRFHILVPHLMGYGKETGRNFNAETCTEELIGFIMGLDKKVLLIGFSLGSQLAYSIVSRAYQYLNGAILISPWLIKEEPLLSKIMAENEKQFMSFKKKWLCRFIGMMNGLPKKENAEFVEQMQRVTIETLRKSVDNGITLSSEEGFKDADIPILALCGGKEPVVVTDSIKALAAMNKNCTYEVWEKAAHNIPPLFYKKLNEIIINYNKEQK